MYRFTLALILYTVKVFPKRKIFGWHRSRKFINWKSERLISHKLRLSEYVRNIKRILRGFYAFKHLHPVVGYLMDLCYGFWSSFAFKKKCYKTRQKKLKMHDLICFAHIANRIDKTKIGIK